jgi:hypothetical protein
MRNLTTEEIAEALDDNGESEEGCVAVEATIEELADLNVRTICGANDNRVFGELAERGYGKKRCRGWYLAKDASKEGGLDQTVWGMFHIAVTEEDAEKVARIADKMGGSLRFSGPSLWKGFFEYEIE